MVNLLLYNLVLLLVSPVTIVIILWRLIVVGKSREGFQERLGFIPANKLTTDGPRIWLHAVSVGETVAAKPVWEALMAGLPGWRLFHSTITGTGQEQAVKAVGERGEVIYLPFDFFPCVWLSLSRVHPQLLMLVETELWPNFIAVAKLRGCRVMMVNGIVSDHSMRWAKLLAPLYRWMTRNLDRCCMQSREDAERIIQLGADPARVTVVGNTKFDQVHTEVSLGEQVTLRDQLKLTREEPVLLAGSTHHGEEEIILRAFRQVKSTSKRVRLIIAPRNIQRAQEVEELVVSHGFAVTRRTKLATMPPPPDAVIILDTIGELARAYALCTAAFIGGSLVPIGGHNVLEPLALGKPVIFGPYMHKNRDITAIVLEAGVCFQITTPDDLAKQWLEFLTSTRPRKELAERTKAVFQQHRGASQRCVAEAVNLIGQTITTPADGSPS